MFIIFDPDNTPEASAYEDETEAEVEFQYRKFLFHERASLYKVLGLKRIQGRKLNEIHPDSIIDS